MGFHWTPCNRPFGALIPIGVFILCITVAHNLPIILRGLITAIELGCLSLAVGMVLTSLVFAGMMKWLMPHTIVGGRLAGRRIEYVEANDNPRKEITYPDRYILRGGNVIPILPRSSYEWQDDGQLVISKGRDSRPTR